MKELQSKRILYVFYRFFITIFQIMKKNLSKLTEYAEKLGIGIILYNYAGMIL